MLGKLEARNVRAIFSEPFGVILVNLRGKQTSGIFFCQVVWVLVFLRLLMLFLFFVVFFLLILVLFLLIVVLFFGFLLLFR